MLIRNLTIASVAGMAVAFGAYCWLRHTEFEREVAERKKAQEALRQNELRLRTLVDNAPVVLFALDGDGVITASEGQGLKISSEKLPDHSYGHLLHKHPEVVRPRDLIRNPVGYFASAAR
jgi:PAS domain-containing protein